MDLKGHPLGPPAYVFTFLFSLVSAALFCSFYFDKHFSADGVFYFIYILDGGKISDLVWHRRFGSYLTLWPLALAVASGIKDLSLLSKIFAFGIYLPYVLSFAACLYALRGENKVLMSVVLASMVSNNLQSDYILAGTHQVMMNWSWPILLLLLRRTRLSRLDGVVLWVLLALFACIYETAVIPAAVFAAACVVRLYFFRQGDQLVIIGGALCLCLLVISISSYFILNPAIQSNKESFVSGVMSVRQNYGALTAAGFIFLFAAGLLLKRPAVVAASLLPVSLYIAVIFFFGHSASSDVSFSGRTLSATLLNAYIFLAIVFWYFKVDLKKFGMLVYCLFILVMCVSNVYTLRSWAGFRRDFIATLNGNSGFVAIENTVLDNSRFGWPWNNSQLALVWSAPCVKTIVLNKKGVKWEPFNPLQTIVLKNHLLYDDYFKRVDPRIRTCG